MQNIITTSYNQNQNETKNLGVEKKIFDICEHYSYITFSVVIKIFKKKTHQIIFLFFVQLSLIFFTENSVKSTSTTKESTSSSNYLRNHHQPDLVKVSQSPKVVTSNAELARLEHILDEKNRENERLRARLGHNAKGFEALAVTVNHLAKKVNWIFNYISFSEGCNIISKISYHIFHLFAARILPSPQCKFMNFQFYRVTISCTGKPYA